MPMAKGLEGRDEAAGGGVHMNAHLKALRGVQLLQLGVHLPHGVVLPTVVVAHDADLRNSLRSTRHGLKRLNCHGSTWFWPEN